jgi:L,D-peptidoglycan transpeptidase YkuD (ErfK/YbiS/YcfS/YnhG family)
VCGTSAAVAGVTVPVKVDDGDGAADGDGLGDGVGAALDGGAATGPPAAGRWHPDRVMASTATRASRASLTRTRYRLVESPHVSAARTVLVALALGTLALVTTGDTVARPRPVAAPVPRDPTVAPVPVSVDDPPEPSPSASPSAAASPSPSASPRRTATTRPTPGRTPGTAAPRPDNLASRLHTLPAGTTQVIIAYAPSYAATTGALETYQKVNGVWQAALPRMALRLGTKGFSDAKVEGDLTTPTGVYRIGGTMYGIAANPGVRYVYHQLVADDYWDENSASPAYNSFVHGTDPGGGSEKLWQVTPQYTYLAVIDYNTPPVPADPARGSGIFLHVSAGRATAGCLALAQADLVAVLRWLNPAASPRIVMAPSTVLGRY